MEAVGLVFGVIPLAIVALKCFKTGKRLTSMLRNRKRHIETLIRALETYNGYLELLLEWLLRSVDIYDETKHRTHRDISFLLQNPETIEKMREVLGSNPSSAFGNAIGNGQRAVETIMKNIDDLLPGDQEVSHRNETEIGIC